MALQTRFLSKSPLGDEANLPWDGFCQCKDWRYFKTTWKSSLSFCGELDTSHSDTRGIQDRCRCKAYRLGNLPVSQCPINGGHQVWNHPSLSNHLFSVEGTSIEESCNEPYHILMATRSRRHQFSNFRAISLAFSFLIFFYFLYLCRNVRYIAYITAVFPGKIKISGP